MIKKPLVLIYRSLGIAFFAGSLFSVAVQAQQTGSQQQQRRSLLVNGKRGGNSGAETPPPDKPRPNAVPDSGYRGAESAGTGPVPPAAERMPRVPASQTSPGPKKQTNADSPITDEDEKKPLFKKAEAESDRLSVDDAEELRALVVNRRAQFLVNQKATYLANRKEIKREEKELEKEDESIKTLAVSDKSESIDKNVPRVSNIGANDLVAISQGTTVSYTTKVIKTVKTYQPVFQPTVPQTVQMTSGRGIPSQWANWIVYYGKRANVDPLLILEVMRQESTFNSKIKSPVGAAGLMQFMPATASRFGINPLDPEQAIRGGAAYLAFLLNRYGGNVFSALAAYNAGEGAVDCFLTGRTLRLKNGKVINGGNRRTQHGVPPYTETQNYVQKISSKYFRALQITRR